MRSFLILAQYAARTVLDEEIEKLHNHGGVLWPPSNAWWFLRAWMAYANVGLKLHAYEWVLYFRGMAGMDNSLPDPAAG